MELPKTNCTELQWFSVVLLNVVVAVHQTPVVNTVQNCKHMTYLMNHCSDWRIKNLLPVDFRSISLSKISIPSHKREYADSWSIGCPSINIVPVCSRIYVFERNTHHAISILRNTLLPHIRQNIGTEELITVYIFSVGNVWDSFEQILFWEDLH